jgi:hypothetical protein
MNNDNQTTDIDLDAEIKRFNAIVKAMFDNADIRLNELKAVANDCTEAIKTFKANLENVEWEQARAPFPPIASWEAWVD